MKKMRIIVLGVTGMLGYQVMREAVKRGHDTTGTVRKPSNLPKDWRLVEIDDELILPECDLIINCVGLVKQYCNKQNSSVVFTNSLLPHLLTEKYPYTKILQISSDCVFSGKKGSYSDAETPDPVDIYGMSKYLGEITDNPNVLTIRTSIIGLEQHKPKEKRTGLLEWFLVQKGAVNGYTHATWSGFTTNELARILLDLGEKMVSKEITGGLMHVSNEPISKYDLLVLIRKVFDKQIIIQSDDTVKCFRSLTPSDSFTKLFLELLDYKTMLEIVKDEYDTANKLQ